MGVLILIGYCILGFLLCWSIIPFVRKAALHYGWADDHKSFHHTHKMPVPRFGGIAFGIAFILLGGMALMMGNPARFQANLTLYLGSLAMLTMGLCDDFRPLGAKVKLLAQMLIAVGTYLGGLRIEVIGDPFSGHTIELGILSLPITVLWLVALTNLINLIDGIDGLAGGISLMVMVLLVYVGFQTFTFPTLVAAGMIGVLVGFLRFNFPPATIYMGDGGAYFLGFLMGGLTVVTSHKGTIAAAMAAPLFCLALPILDVTLAICRRGLKGLPVFRPDRQHIHHRLVALGFSRRRTVLILYSLTALCFCMALAVFWSQGRLMPVLAGALFIVIGISAHFFGFIRNFTDITGQFDSSLQLRKDTRNALAMMNWLQVEAECCDTMQELWASYCLMVRRLGFTQIKLIIHDEPDQRVKSNPFDRNNGDKQNCLRQEISFANMQAIEFEADISFSAKSFEHLSELAAEAWLKAAQIWQKHHEFHNVRFSNTPPQTGLVKSPGEVFLAE